MDLENPQFAIFDNSVTNFGKSYEELNGHCTKVLNAKAEIEILNGIYYRRRPA